MCGVHVYVFNQYKVAVEKHDHMTKLFSNPNVRVASGENAKKILEEITPKVE